jgi:PAS domain S-box-containing protein/putative nucleotidyltransferase with HDIG domain
MAILRWMTPRLRQRAEGSFLGTGPTLAFTALLALTLIVLPLVNPDIADFPLLLFMVPVGLCAGRFGARGGLKAAALGALIAAFWYLHDQAFTSGVPDLLTQVIVFGLVGGMVGAVVDARRDVERALTNHQELSLDLICTASFDGFFTRVNPAGQHLLGYRPEELLARPFIDFVHPDDREVTLAELKRQTDAGQSVLNFKNRYRCSDGSYRWLEWCSRPDPERNNLVAVARDVSERVAAEEAMANYRSELEEAVRDRTAELEDSRLETLRRLALAAEYRDDSTYEHTERVGRTAFLVARALGCPEEEAALIRLAAPLHDVGKLGVSDRILLKPGKLTAAEFEQVKKHTVGGAHILRDSRSAILRLAEEIALHHHEWWNGKGYPHGLRGLEIPVAARIVALADVFDALTHERPYKHAWPVDEATREIKRLSGRQFDPAVVTAFGELDPDALAELPEHEPARPPVGSFAGLA